MIISCFKILFSVILFLITSAITITILITCLDTFVGWKRWKDAPYYLVDFQTKEPLARFSRIDFRYEYGTLLILKQDVPRLSHSKLYILQDPSQYVLGYYKIQNIGEEDQIFLTNFLCYVVDLKSESNLNVIRRVGDDSDNSGL